MKPRNRRISYLLLITAGMLLFLDALLYWIDPVGITRYIEDYNRLQQYATPALHGMVYAPGTYRLRMYTATVGLDGFRAVPETRGGDCRIAFIGDSVTFGMGSDISFVDLLAPDIPATVINAGITGYSAANIQALVETIPADGYVWLIVWNDDAEFLKWQRPSGNIPPATWLYFNHYFAPRPPEVNDPTQFVDPAQAVLARSDVLAFAFKDMHLSDVIAREFPGRAQFIEMYRSFVSGYDFHPDETGHAQIAGAMHDAVIVFAGQQCD